MQKFSKKYLKSAAEINSGEISESFIRGFRKALHAAQRTAQGYSTSCTAPKIAFEELDKLLTLIREKQPRVTVAQGEKGAAWLRNLYKTPKGRERLNNPFSAHDVKVLENYSHFTLVDFEELNQSRGLAFWVPVYRMIAITGESFDYYAVSWQSGGNGPVIVDRNWPRAA